MTCSTLETSPAKPRDHRTRSGFTSTCKTRRNTHFFVHGTGRMYINIALEQNAILKKSHRSGYTSTASALGHWGVEGGEFAPPYVLLRLLGCWFAVGC
eukprot:4440165-Amphidinium_carterae.2